jgi:2-acylglycerol O-acyltransferase 2
MASTPEWNLPRHTDLVSRAISFVLAFIFAHYFFWATWVVGFLLLLVYVGLLSFTALLVFSGLYLAQIVMYRPQNDKGWDYFWFLYSPIWDYVLAYGNSTFIREEELDPAGGPYMFAFAPHGVLATCRASTCGSIWSRMFPGIHGRWASFTGAFFIPAVREFSLFSGALDASKRVLQKILNRGESLFIIPGGSAELMLTDTTTDTKMVITDRKGFVKLAIAHGTDIVPVFCFGEKWTASLSALPEPFCSYFYSLTKCVPITVVGRWFTFVGKVERNGKPLNMGWVYGERIKVKKMEEPTPE